MTFKGSPYLGVVNWEGQGAKDGSARRGGAHIDELATEDSGIGPANLGLG